jgi:malonyl-CoA O-methyltransferase
MTVLAPREAYQRLAVSYDSSPNALIALEERVMQPLIPESLAGRTVIDVASGTGRWARYCSARGARSVALDFCFEMRPAVQADAALLPLPDACSDLTICAFAVGYAPGCFAELVRITRPGATILVSDVHPEALKRGWTRSFRHGAEVIHVAHHPYEISDLRSAAIELSGLMQPHLGPAERGIFEQAGQLHRFEEACRVRAIFVGSWIRR